MELSCHHQHDLLIEVFLEMPLFSSLLAVSDSDCHKYHICPNIALLGLVNMNGFVLFIDQYLWREDGFIGSAHVTVSEMFLEESHVFEEKTNLYWKKVKR